MAAIAMNADNSSRIAEWYRDRSILITGGTGFMGKVLIEKLLRACPNIKNIYLLVRTKRGQEPRERIDDMIQLPVSMFFLVFRSFVLTRKFCSSYLKICVKSTNFLSKMFLVS